MVPGLTTMFLPITLPEIEKPTPNTSPWLPEILIGPGYLFYHSSPVHKQDNIYLLMGCLSDGRNYSNRA